MDDGFTVLNVEIIGVIQISLKARLAIYFSEIGVRCYQITPLQEKIFEMEYGSCGQNLTTQNIAENLVRREGESEKVK